MNARTEVLPQTPILEDLGERSAGSNATTRKVADASPSSRKSSRALIAYGALAAPLCVAGIPIVTYLPAFYAQELHLTAAWVGVVFLLARLWDGASDLLIGWLSDRTRSRWGRRKPWVIAGAPLVMGSTWLLCNPPAGVALGYLGFWAALFYTAWTATYIPYVSWGTELAADYVERSRVSSFRETFTILGILFIVAAPLVLLPADPPLAKVLFLITLTVVVSTPIALVPLALRVPDPLPEHATQSRLLRELAEVARDRVLIRFAIARLFWSTAEGVNNSLSVFSFTVGLDLPGKFFWAIFALYVATLGFLPITLRLAKNVEKHTLLAAGIAIQALVYLTTLFIPAGNFPLVMILWALIGVANTALLSIPSSIIADIIDHGEVTSGDRRSGAYVALDNLVYKVGLALGVGLSFSLLSFFHYDPGAAHHTLADARHIRLLGFALPCLLSAPAIWLILTHTITRKEQRRLRDQIDARNRSVTA